MISRLRPAAVLLLSLLVLPTGLRAQDQSNGTLHVLRPTINAEQDTAELCLEFDHALDLADHGRLIAGIHLESEGKPVTLMPANVNLASSSLCLQALAHRQSYSLTVADLRGTGGEKLAEPYKLSFTVPDRQPSLAFVADLDAGGLVRVGEGDPVLRAVNVARARITLYRVTDPARMADAYRQRLQTTLAPAESLAFARDNGQLVWQGELVLDDGGNEKSANQTIEHPVPLHAAAGALAPGLYFIAAADAAPPVKTKTDAAALAPVAAQWFVRSDLRIRALHKDDGLAVETSNAAASAIVKNARLILFDRNGQVMAEGKSDNAGLGFLPLPQDKRADAQMLVGLTDVGDVDCVDVSADEKAEPENRFTLPDLEASLAADRPFYAPGATVTLTLIAHTIHGEALTLPGSTVQILRPDRSLYATLPVSEGKNGVSYLSFPAPAAGGLWPIVWQQPDRGELAHGTLRVTANRQAPAVTMIADRAALGDDGALDLSLASVTYTGAPAPYVAGHILVQWSKPDALTGWNDYRFGVDGKTDDAPKTVAAFVTDANGEARVHLELKPPGDQAALRTAIVSVRTEPAAGALAPDLLSLPVKPGNYVIGIKPLAPGGKFPENSMARFDVITLDGDGKRREDSDLRYQIYEEGRSFSWYQAEGRWEYKPLQQRRRAGGGTLDIKANGDNLIRWPVTAGAYTLEITDAGGELLARFHFDAGWGLSKSDQNPPADLALTPNAPAVEVGVPVKIGFTLDRPAVVTAVIADDHIRKIIFEPRAAGENTIAFTPAEDWGDRVRVRIEAEQDAGGHTMLLAGQSELPVHHQPKELGLAVNAPDHAAPGQDLPLAVTASNIVAQQPVFVDVLATPLPADNAADVPASVLTPAVAADTYGKATVHLAVPSFSGDLHLAIEAAGQNQLGHKELSIPVHNTFAADLDMPPLMHTGDVLRLSLALTDNDAPAGSYHYALSAIGLKISGTLTGTSDFAAGARKTIPFDVQAPESGSGELKFDLTDGHDFHISRLWPVPVIADGETVTDTVKSQIEPRQSWTLAAGKPRARAKPEAVLWFLAPQPLFDAPQMLGPLVWAEPFTASEMASWLEAVRLWRDVIVEAGILPAPVLQMRQTEILQRLLARQKADGGFSSLPANDSDAVSTADALLALARANEAVAAPAVDAAAGWLQQRLANSWLEENQRSARAAAFAALAAIDRLDVSSLRYFADTAAGKPLPPLAMAQLAAALAKSNDQDKAAPWLKAVHDGIAADPALLPVLADNPLFDPHDLLPVLQKLSDDLMHHPSHDPRTLAAFLRALGAVQNRAGDWRVSVGGVEKNQKGVLVLALSGKADMPVFYNPMDAPLYVIGGKKVTAPPRGAGAIARHIYQPDGAAVVSGDLKQGEIYLIVLEGTAGPDDNPARALFVREWSGIGLHPLGCALDNGVAAAEAWGWFRNFLLTPIASCEAGGGALDVVLTPPAAGGPWRVAYFAQADHAGAFGLMPPVARALFGNAWAAGGDQRIRVE